VHAVECAFGDRDEGWVEVHLAGVKAAARMREKLGKYAPPHPRARWPLSANILDPVRVSVVCGGPSQVLEAVEWFMRLDPDQRRVMAVVRAKNKFSDAREEVGRCTPARVCVNAQSHTHTHARTRTHARARPHTHTQLRALSLPLIYTHTNFSNSNTTQLP
jgi:hypothetical protein